MANVGRYYTIRPMDHMGIFSKKLKENKNLGKSMQFQ